MKRHGYAIVLFALIATLTWVAHLLTRRHVYYGGQ